MTGFESKRQMAQAKLDDDDDTQVYADTLLIAYQRGFADGKRAAQPEQQAKPIGFINSPGPITQYIIPTQRPWVGLTDEDKKKIATAAGCTDDDDGHIVTEIFRLAEAKLKERNT